MNLMSEAAPDATTAQLIELGQCRPEAHARLASLVYDQLHQLAASQMSRERRSHTLQPTALVHEAFLRLRAGLPPAPAPSFSPLPPASCAGYWWITPAPAVPKNEAAEPCCL